MTTALTTLTRDFNGHAFVFRDDGWFNMTKAAKHFGKDLSNFWKSCDTREYLEALKATVVSTEAVKAVRGQGTWAHPKLAVFFARWLDVRFAVWCDAVIDDILKGKAGVVITKPEESAPKIHCKFLRRYLRVNAGLLSPVPPPPPPLTGQEEAKGTDLGSRRAVELDEPGGPASASAPKAVGLNADDPQHHKLGFNGSF